MGCSRPTSLMLATKSRSASADRRTFLSSSSVRGSSCSTIRVVAPAMVVLHFRQRAGRRPLDGRPFVSPPDGLMAARKGWSATAGTVRTAGKFTGNQGACDRREVVRWPGGADGAAVARRPCRARIVTTGGETRSYSADEVGTSFRPPGRRLKLHSAARWRSWAVILKNPLPPRSCWSPSSSWPCAP
jgi:hypothetical protein